MFKTIQTHNPELWVWLGDAAYADLRFSFNNNNFDYQYSLNIFNQSKNNECKQIIIFLLRNKKN